MLSENILTSKYSRFTVHCIWALFHPDDNHLLLPAYSQENQLAASAYPQLLVSSHSDCIIYMYMYKWNQEYWWNLYVPTFRLLSVNVGLLVSLVSPDIKVSGATATADVCLIHSLMSISVLLGDNWSFDRDSFCISLETSFVSSWSLVIVCWTHPANQIHLIKQIWSFTFAHAKV